MALMDGRVECCTSAFVVEGVRSTGTRVKQIGHTPIMIMNYEDRRFGTNTKTVHSSKKYTPRYLQTQ
jgi:hypothetical protein